MSDMSLTGTPGKSPDFSVWLKSNKGVMIAACVFLAIFAAVSALSAAPMAYFDYQYISSGALTTAIAAVGATIVILSGGFDLSVGAVVALVNVAAASLLGDTMGSQVLGFAAGIAIGGAVGAVNGYFIAFLRLQSIVVTLATMFVVGGFALLVRSDPGGYVPAEFSAFFVGSLIEGYVPAAVGVLFVVAGAWVLLKRTRFGTAIYAIGTDREAAAYSGIDVRWTEFWVYTVAGAVYGLAGLIVTAQTTTGDPLIGRSLLLEVFTAVVLGGTLLGGGRGGCIGTILGAYSLMLIINILLVLNIPAFYATIVQATILLAAAVGLNIGGMGESVRWLRSSLARRHSQRRLDKATLPVLGTDPNRPNWLALSRPVLKYVAPAYVAFIAIVLAHAMINGGVGAHYFRSLLLLSSFLAILALGQGAVILVGGLDLSVGWAITFCGIAMGQLSMGDDGTLVWAVPVVLLSGLAIGLFNGFLIVFFRLPAIVVTLAMNGLLQGIALLATGGTPTGFAPNGLRWFMSGTVLGVSPVVIFTVAFAVLGYLLLSKTTLGRRIFAVGNNPRVAYLSGVNIGTTTICVYALSGLCSAIVGVMLTGFSGRAILGMGDAYLLSSIAVVVIGGTLITGGRGSYIGMIGGVLLLVALQILLTSILVPPAVRDIIYGLVILIAIVALRERETHSA